MDTPTETLNAISSLTMSVTTAPPMRAIRGHEEVDIPAVLVSVAVGDQQVLHKFTVPELEDGFTRLDVYAAIIADFAARAGDGFNAAVEALEAHPTHVLPVNL
jgi:hydrogenase maturation factor